MKTVNKLIIALFLAFSFNAIASTKIESITLSDNSVISSKEISDVHINHDRSVDYIDLHDGSRIEGTDVKAISLTKFDSRLQTRAAVRTGGDGSGG